MSGRPEVPFAPVSYLRDRAWAVILGVFCVAFLAFMLGVLGLGPHAIFVCAAFVTLCLATMLAWGYLRRRRWYRALFSLRTSSLSRDYRIVETPLAQVCRESIKSLANLLIDSGVGVQVDIGAQVRVQTDASWLRFVVRQVLSNAAQYGACTVGFSVAEGPAALGLDGVVLQVCDDGAGVPSDEVPHVFDRGYSGTNGRNEGTSTGYGLFLAAEVCREMGLGLTFASEEGRGSRALVSFPQDRSRLNLTKA